MPNILWRAINNLFIRTSTCQTFYGGLLTIYLYVPAHAKHFMEGYQQFIYKYQHMPNILWRAINNLFISTSTCQTFYGGLSTIYLYIPAHAKHFMEGYQQFIYKYQHMPNILWRAINNLFIRTSTCQTFYGGLSTIYLYVPAHAKHFMEGY